MFELLRSPWSAQFDVLLNAASKGLLLCAPYIGSEPCERVRSRLAARDSSGLNLMILTDLSLDNIVSGATDAAALASLCRRHPSAVVRFLPSLHAKVYVADARRAIVTSGNMTTNGLHRNFEYGVLFDDPEIVQKIQRDVSEYAGLGSPVDVSQLEAFASAAEELRSMQRAMERSMRSRLRREFDQRLRQVDDQLLRARAGGRSAHAIFADAILHLLRERPMSTVDINRAVQQIHPDLCNDAEDRVINGQHFGKKWKHGVRTAQVFLRRRGDIELSEGLWRLKP